MQRARTQGLFVSTVSPPPLTLLYTAVPHDPREEVSADDVETMMSSRRAEIDQKVKLAVLVKRNGRKNPRKIHVPQSREC